MVRLAPGRWSPIGNRPLPPFLRGSPCRRRGDLPSPSDANGDRDLFDGILD